MHYPPHQPLMPHPPHVVRQGLGGLAVGLIAVGSLGAGFLGGFVIGSLGSTSSSTGRAPVAAVVDRGSDQNATDQGAEPAEESQSEEQSESDYTPKPSDFSVAIRVVSKSCYSFGGCYINYRVQAAYKGQALAPDKEFTVSYELIGGNNQKIGSFKIVGNKIDYGLFGENDSISVPSEGTVLRATVTQVL